MSILGLGAASEMQLGTVDPALAAIIREVAQYFPLKVSEGHRNEERQNEAYRTKKSKLQWPKSKHNRYPSIAVDVLPLKVKDGKVVVDWDDWKLFAMMAGLIIATGKCRGVKIRWGADWDSDFDLDEEKFRDGPHFELVEEGVEEIGS